MNSIIFILKKLIPLMQELLKLKKNEEMVRRVCGEEGLNETETMEICATIYAESGFDNEVIHDNQDGAVLKKNYPIEYAKFVQATGRQNSRDYYICQFNDFWWYFYKNNHRIIPEQAKDIPTAVKIMIEAYKAGRIKDWYGYKSKLYYSYMKRGEL